MLLNHFMGREVTGRLNSGERQSMALKGVRAIKA